jgi:hypothetical protein
MWVTLNNLGSRLIVTTATKAHHEAYGSIDTSEPPKIRAEEHMGPKAEAVSRCHI